MKIKSVELMRRIRDRMSQETQGMSWTEERDYLRKHSSSLDGLLKEVPNVKGKSCERSEPRLGAFHKGGVHLSAVSAALQTPNPIGKGT